MEAHMRLYEADQLPVRLIPLHTDYRNLLLRNALPQPLRRSHYVYALAVCPKANLFRANG